MMFTQSLAMVGLVAVLQHATTAVTAVSLPAQELERSAHQVHRRSGSSAQSDSGKSRSGSNGSKKKSGRENSKVQKNDDGSVNCEHATWIIEGPADLEDAVYNQCNDLADILIEWNSTSSATVSIPTTTVGNVKIQVMPGSAAGLGAVTFANLVTVGDVYVSAKQEGVGIARINLPKVETMDELLVGSKKEPLHGVIGSIRVATDSTLKKLKLTVKSAENGKGSIGDIHVTSVAEVGDLKVETGATVGDIYINAGPSDTCSAGRDRRDVKLNTEALIKVKKMELKTSRGGSIAGFTAFGFGHIEDKIKLEAKGGSKISNVLIVGGKDGINVKKVELKAKEASTVTNVQLIRVAAVKEDVKIKSEDEGSSLLNVRIDGQVFGVFKPDDGETKLSSFERTIDCDPNETTVTAAYRAAAEAAAAEEDAFKTTITTTTVAATITTTTVAATVAPATKAPVTDAPTTVAATDAPATDAPATDAPATEAPVTDAPATDAPATDAPATDAPAVDEIAVGGEEATVAPSTGELVLPGPVVGGDESVDGIVAVEAVVDEVAAESTAPPSDLSEDGATAGEVDAVPVEVVVKVAALPSEANSECDAAMIALTGNKCLNGGICSFRRADCADTAAPFDTPVCSCGAPDGAVCFWGEFCENKVDECPEDSNSCNIVKTLKVGVNPAERVCSADSWPKRLCIADAPAVASASAALWDNDESFETTVEASSSNAGGAVAGVMIVGLLLAGAIFYKKKVAAHDGGADALKVNGSAAINMLSAAGDPMYSDEVAVAGKSNPMYGMTSTGDDMYEEPVPFDGGEGGDAMYDLAGNGAADGYLAVGADAAEPMYDLSTMAKGASMASEGEAMYDMATMGNDASMPEEAMYDMATMGKGASISNPLYDFGGAIQAISEAPNKKQEKKKSVKVNKLDASKISATQANEAEESAAARAARLAMENALNTNGAGTFILEKKLRSHKDTTFDKAGASTIASAITAQASTKAPKKEKMSKKEKKQSVKDRKKSSPLLAVVMGAGSDMYSQINITPGEV